MSKIVLTGGGTAGHVTPNLALLPYLKNHFKEIHYIGSINGIEKQIIDQYPEIIYHEIPTVKLIRGLNFKNLLIPAKLINSVIQAKKILKKIKPDIIFSKGGFVAVPVCFAGSSFKIPIIGHESDFSMGLANKLIYKKCKTMCFSFKSTAEKYKEKGLYTGSPIKDDLFKGKKIETLKHYNLSLTKPTILITGGSLGAKKINDTIFNSINKLTSKYNVIHIVGKNNKNESIKVENYKQIEFSNNIKDLYACSDLVISRAGSNTIFELLSLNKLMILIPLPKGNSRGDQIENARYFKENNYATVIDQDKLNSQLLLSTINLVFRNKNHFINSMKKYKSIANKIIIKEILKYKR